MTTDPKVYRIVLCGGPCAGKTTSLSRLRTFLENRGFNVYVIPEAGTFCCSCGMNFAHPAHVQRAISTTQYLHEETWLKYARDVAQVTGKSAVILLDRALLDGAVYVPQSEFVSLLSTINVPGVTEESTDFSAVLKRYDAVCHLVTAADGAREFYSFDNEVRHESPEQAIQIDRALQKVYSAHPRFFVFRNEGAFEQKLRALVHRVARVVGAPHTKRAPRKFLLRTKTLPQLPLNFVLENTAITRFAVRKVYLQHFDQGDSNNEFTFIRRRTRWVDESPMRRARSPPFSAMPPPLDLSGAGDMLLDESLESPLASPQRMSGASHMAPLSPLLHPMSPEMATRLDEDDEPKSTQCVFKSVMEESGQRIERRRALSRREFGRYEEQFADPQRHVIKQNKVSFEYHGDLIELVQYLSPYPGLCIVNVYENDDETRERFHEGEAPPSPKVGEMLPAFLAELVVREVSHDFDFSAHSLSLKDKEAPGDWVDIAES